MCRVAAQRCRQAYVAVTEALVQGSYWSGRAAAHMTIRDECESVRAGEKVALAARP